jgi:hypothetical protein
MPNKKLKLKHKVLIMHTSTAIHIAISFKSIPSLTLKIKKIFASELESEQGDISTGKPFGRNTPYHQLLQNLKFYDFDNIGDLRLLVPEDCDQFDDEQIGFTVCTLTF